MSSCFRSVGGGFVPGVCIATMAKVASSNPPRLERICACATHAPSPKAWLDSKETPPSPPGWRSGERAGGSFASGAAVGAAWSGRARSGSSRRWVPRRARPRCPRARARVSPREGEGGDARPGTRGGGCRVANTPCAPVGEVNRHTAGPRRRTRVARARRRRRRPRTHRARTARRSALPGRRGGLRGTTTRTTRHRRGADARRSPRLAPGREWGHAARRTASNAADTDAATPSPRGAIPN